MCYAAKDFRGVESYGKAVSVIQKERLEAGLPRQLTQSPDIHRQCSLDVVF